MSYLPPTSHAARFQPFFSVLNDTGVNVERLLSKQHFSSRILDEPDLIVPSRTVYGTVSKVARKEGIKGIDFCVAKLMSFDQIESWIKSQLMSTATLGEMLQRYCEIANDYNSYHSYTLNIDDRLARICCTSLPGPKLGRLRRASEWSNLGVFLQLFKHVLGDQFVPTAITFETTGHLTFEMRDFFGTTRVLQDWTTSSVVVPKHLLTATPPETNLNACASDVPTPKSFPALMRELLKPGLSEICPDINIAAEMSGYSLRTFQRRLSESGLTYSKLLEQTRMEVARTLLTKEDCKVIDVGCEVGYSDPSHFTRAFRRVHGVTPKAYRIGYSQNKST